MKTVPVISFSGTNSFKGLPLLDSQYKSLLMFSFKLICALKSEVVAYGANRKECGFPVISTSEIEITNLFDLKTKLKRELGC